MSEEQKNNDGYVKIKGIFSSQEVKKVGTGTTSRKTIQKAFWDAIEQDSGNIEVQPLNSNYIPSGPKRTIPRDEFLTKFSPEPEFYTVNVLPKIREINKTIARADRHRANGESFSAEMEYSSALKIDEENIRANFGLGLTYLDRGDTGKADNIFERLVKLDGAFEQEHKHLFNEFGISLRKNKMIDQAVDYYKRAIEISPDDENLSCNMGRAYLEKEDYSNAAIHFIKALELDPKHEIAAKAVMWLQAKNFLNPEQKKKIESILPQS
ncbi:tetratricopeptide repeat protein [Desulfovibrio litoralis]|uniref:Tetratricopeptide repeat-containing protein n=1 Tax=Desulfovibrio litoralis DSM 11393 TaxID=1121455 RepID=A0A1M7SG00_9BACT|nr:tetratricopeptide repeat protein [Desulfovibrio litoralis]SHN57401.1 Tetratricopeptide repeat-containing protein [Desulfovibrio litoralis DSM 11393]